MKKVKCGLREILKIFNSFKSILLFLALSGFFWVLLVIAPNIESLSLSGIEFTRDLFDLFLGFTRFSQISTLLISLLFGLNLVVFKEIQSGDPRANGKTKVAATGGLLFSILGAGCGACGILAISFLSFFGMGSLVAALPLGGAEFDIAGIILLTASLILILDKLIENKCKINHGKQ